MLFYILEKNSQRELSTANTPSDIKFGAALCRIIASLKDTFFDILEFFPVYANRENAMSNQAEILDLLMFIFNLIPFTSQEPSYCFAPLFVTLKVSINFSRIPLW